MDLETDRIGRRAFMLTDPIRTMLALCEHDRAPFPATVLFNEDWLLRLVLDWFAKSESAREEGHPLAPANGAMWYSESLLPSAFLPRYKGDRLAESRTHADSMIGHIRVGRRGATDLSLCPNTDRPQLAVVEAKIYGGLSQGVKNAPFFDQAARSVACLAEILRRADRPPEEMGTLGFFLVAPRARIDEGIFDHDLGHRAIRHKVQARVEAYEGSLDPWYKAWFVPTLTRLDIRLFAWEDLIDAISHEDMEAGQLIDSFYGTCLKHNRPRRAAAPERQTVPAWACAPTR